VFPKGLEVILVGFYPIAAALPVAECKGSEKEKYLESARYHMLWTIAAILLVLWLLGLVSSYTLGGFIHVLLVVAIVMVLVRLIQGRRLL
jgi:hypothetical protein